MAIEQIDSLSDLYTHQLEDLYSAEQQIIDSLPKLAEGAETPELREAFEEHLQQTREQMNRLKRIMSEHDISESDVEKCEGMEGIIKEGEEILGADLEPLMRDAGIVAAAQRVEHYEIAGYSVARSMARALGYADAYDLLGLTLEEETMADERLSEIGEALFSAAADEEAEEEEETFAGMELDEEEEDTTRESH